MTKLVPNELAMREIAQFKDDIMLFARPIDIDSLEDEVHNVYLVKSWRGCKQDMAFSAVYTEAVVNRYFGHGFDDSTRDLFDGLTKCNGIIRLTVTPVQVDCLRGLRTCDISDPFPISHVRVGDIVGRNTLDLTEAYPRLYPPINYYTQVSDERAFDLLLDYLSEYDSMSAAERLLHPAKSLYISITDGNSIYNKRQPNLVDILTNINNVMHPITDRCPMTMALGVKDRYTKYLNQRVSKMMSVRLG